MNDNPFDPMTPTPREAEAPEFTLGTPLTLLPGGGLAHDPDFEESKLVGILDDGSWLPLRIRQLLDAGVLSRDDANYTHRRVVPWMAMPVAAADWSRWPMLENREGGYVSHPERRKAAILEGRCPACGEKLGRHWAFLLRPDEALLGMTTEAPHHLDCARWLAMERQRWSLTEAQMARKPGQSELFLDRIVEAGGGDTDGMTLDPLESFPARLLWNLDHHRVGVNKSGPRLGFELLGKPEIGEIVTWYLHSDDEAQGGLSVVLERALDWLEERLRSVNEAMEIRTKMAIGRRVEWLEKLGIA